MRKAHRKKKSGNRRAMKFALGIVATILQVIVNLIILIDYLTR